MCLLIWMNFRAARSARAPKASRAKPTVTPSIPETEFGETLEQCIRHLRSQHDRIQELEDIVSALGNSSKMRRVRAGLGLDGAKSKAPDPRTHPQEWKAYMRATNPASSGEAQRNGK
jgi:hypothetical protein